MVLLCVRAGFAAFTFAAGAGRGACAIAADPRPRYRHARRAGVWVRERKERHW